jgi:phosphoenolpyruvate carboxykinase (ATP)
MNYGIHNSSKTAEDQGIKGLGNVFYNLIEANLLQEAIKRGEGELGNGGTLLVSTGKHSGRSPKDKFIVKTPTTEKTIWWENNAPMTSESFDLLLNDMLVHMKGNDYFIHDLFAGADKNHRLDVRLITELAWHGLFIRHMLRRPSKLELQEFNPEYTIINCPSFHANPKRHNCRSEVVIAINFDKKMILIAGTEYAGENKKSVFSLLNFILPEKGVMPMHCSANHKNNNPSEAAIFFGLSGTGKTTLSADPNRTLIGDDEHGWSDTGLFNFEGGCYAKTINLDPEAEPEIFATTEKFATVIENMCFDPITKKLDFRDDTISANMRCAYPLEYIANASTTSLAGHPRNIIMLTCDAFGVLPPISRLTPAQAIYHFLSGFTSKIAGTESGITEPEPTFSTCFGAPFMPRRPEVYGQILKEKIASNNVQCWLVNTGWTGGPYGVGARMPIQATRALLTATLNGSLDSANYRRDPLFLFEVPEFVTSVDEKLLDPKKTWKSSKDYNNQAEKLVSMFKDNFEQYLPYVGSDVCDIALG